MSSSGALFATSTCARVVPRGPAASRPRRVASATRAMALNTNGAAGARPARAPRASLARAPLRARPAAAAAAAVPRANRRAGVGDSCPESGAFRPARTRRGVVAAAATSAGREDEDEDIDDVELAALEALDEVDGWGDEDDDEAMAVAAAVAARAVGGDLDDDGALDELEDLEEEEEEEEEGVALLRELFEYGGVDVEEWRHLGEDEDIEVSGIANDSRAVLGGDVFVCCRGAETDGHEYALDAVAAGAVAVVCDRPIAGLSEDTPQVIVADAAAALPRLAAAFYGNPSASLVTVGITGTNGKTTTSFLVRAIIEANDGKCGVIGTTGYVLDDQRLTPHGGVWEPEEADPTENRECTAPGWLAPYEGKYEVPNTTPDALQCQQLMAGMLDNGATATAMEVSSHALAQGRVDCVDFDVAVFTNLTSDHLDFHGTVEAYREAKAELFRGLTDPERQRAVINLDPSDDLANDAKNDEKNGEAFSESDFFIAAAGGGDRVPVITYATHASLSDRADVFVEKAELSLFETIVSIRTPAGSFDAACGLVGEVNVTNIAAAVAVGTALEIPLDVIAAGVEAMEPVPGRMELVDEGQPFPVIVDYAHTPDALRRAIKSVRRTGAANVIVVFGCGGDRDASKRAEMGAVADALCDIVFVTNDNPRTEDPYAILDDITSGFRDRVYNLESIKDEAMFPFLKDMYLIHPNARRETMKLQNACRRYVMVDRWFAIRGAIAMATEDDAVLIAGKGHEDYVVVGNKKHWFDDRAEARDALRKIVTVQESGVDTTNLPWGRVGAVPGNGNVLDA